HLSKKGKGRKICAPFCKFLIRQQPTGPHERCAGSLSKCPEHLRKSKRPRLPPAQDQPTSLRLPGGEYKSRQSLELPLLDARHRPAKSSPCPTRLPLLESWRQLHVFLLMFHPS